MSGLQPKIKVMVLAASLGKGGTERVFSLLLERFDRCRFAPELAVFSPPIAYPVPDDVPVHILSDRPAAAQPHHVDVPADLAERFANDCTWMGAAAAKLAELVDERMPDVLLVSPLWASIIALIGADRFPEATRLINIAGGMTSYWLSDNVHRDLFSYLLRANFARSDRGVAVSGGVAEDLVTGFGVDRDLLSVIHTPSNLSSIKALSTEPVDDLAFAGDVPTVLFVGRLERVKGLEFLLRAVALARESMPIRCILVGEGRQQGYLQALAAHLGIADHVVFAGAQSNPFKYMSRATVFVLPSLSEGMPNVLLEALACGCPVIASDIAGGVTREVLEDGACGLIVPRADTEALAQAILRMIGDPQLRSTLATAGERRARDFDLPLIVRQFEDLIVETVADEGALAPACGPVGTRVLLLTTSLAAGGSQRFLSLLLDHLDPARFALEVATTTQVDDSVLIPARVPLHQLQAEPCIKPATVLDLPAEVIGRLADDSTWIQSLTDQIAHLVCRIRPNVVICAPEWIAAPAAAASARFPSSTRLIARFGAKATLAFPDTPDGFVMRSVAVEYLPRIDAPVAVSQPIADDLVALFSVPPDRIRVMPNAVDIAMIQALSVEPTQSHPGAEAGPVVLFVGRLERVKGLEYLLRAVAAVAASTPLRCVLVGDGSQAPYLQALASHLGIADLVAFEGEQANPFRFMSSATIFVLPSLSEGMPNVLLEAMACGCPVVATDVPGGVARAVLEDGECGLIVPPADAGALAAAIESMLSEPDLRERFKRAGQRRILDFDLPVILRQYEDLIVAGSASDARVRRPAERHADRDYEQRTDGGRVDGA